MTTCGYVITSNSDDVENEDDDDHKVEDESDGENVIPPEGEKD